MSIPDETLARWAAWPRPGTPGPWIQGLASGNPDRRVYQVHPDPAVHQWRHIVGDDGSDDLRDAAFIAHAPEMREAIDVLVAEVRRLREALVEGIDTAEEGWAYASDYFREKWDAEGQIQKMRDALRSAA